MGLYKGLRSATRQINKGLRGSKRGNTTTSSLAQRIFSGLPKAETLAPNSSYLIPCTHPIAIRDGDTQIFRKNVKYLSSLIVCAIKVRCALYLDEEVLAILICAPLMADPSMPGPVTNS